MQKKYGADSAYFEGLFCEKNGDYSKAISYFKQASKKASPLVARRALKKRAELEEVSAKIKTYEEINKIYNDSESRLELCEQYLKYRQYKKILDFTYKMDFSLENSSLWYYRFEALYQSKKKLDKALLYKWITEFPFTELHKTFIEEHELKDEVFLLRKYVYEKKYYLAIDYAESAVKNSTSPLVFSDAGKAFLYASKNFTKAALDFEKFVKNPPSPKASFYVNFYVGRLLSKAGDVQSSMTFFLKAMRSSESPSDYDNALWYFLTESFKLPYTETIRLLEFYAPKWSDPVYFDDFLETLSTNLLSKKLWNEYLQIAKIIEPYASQESLAKYFYVSARLIEEGYISIPESEVKKITNEYFKKAASCKTNLYYFLLAGHKAGFSQKKLEEDLLNFGLKTPVKINKDAERLIEAYADYGLAEYIYDTWLEYSSELSLETALKVSLFLKQCGLIDEKYFPLSLRIASRKLNYPEKKLNKELLALAFPRNYTESVEKYCSDFNLKEELLYALIRSESFFDSSIKSYAGAKGLTQLMDLTAGDVAKKLKVTEYDLNDSDTNIRFGSFYLEELIHRIDESELRALFSYNAGISNVRKWIKTASILFEKEDFANDLFLEALPFTETREYGRKLVSASCMYGFLYYEKTFSEVIRQIMK